MDPFELSLCQNSLLDWTEKPLPKPRTFVICHRPRPGRASVESGGVRGPTMNLNMLAVLVGLMASLIAIGTAVTILARRPERRARLGAWVITIIMGMVLALCIWSMATGRVKP